MDHISNMLTKIRNAQAVDKETVSVFHSKVKMQILKVLAKEGFVKSVDLKGKKIKTINIVLAYGENGKPKIKNIKRVSKNSKRIYVPFKKIKAGKGSFCVQILSTSKGILTGEEAKKEKIGGEIICEII